MISRTDSQISIKGIRDGLLVTLGQGAVEGQLQRLDEELAARQGFLAGSQVALNVGERRLSQQEIAEFQSLLANHEMVLWAILAEWPETKEAARALDLATRLPGSNVDLEGNSINSEGKVDDPQLAPKQELTPGQRSSPADNSLLLRETLRSGRSVFHQGHVVIVGDVNPGAEIIAGGDVIVWGVVRGMVHAGVDGNDSAVICALGLAPTQLRIADFIAISPQGEQQRLVPEMAYVHERQIVAEAWPVKR